MADKKNVEILELGATDTLIEEIKKLVAAISKQLEAEIEKNANTDQTTLTVGTTTLTANSGTSSRGIEIAAGSNVTISADSANGKITISSSNTRIHKWTSGASSVTAKLFSVQSPKGGWGAGAADFSYSSRGSGVGSFSYKFQDTPGSPLEVQTYYTQSSAISASAPRLYLTETGDKWVLTCYASIAPFSTLEVQELSSLKPEPIEWTSTLTAESPTGTLVPQSFLFSGSYDDLANKPVKITSGKGISVDSASGAVSALPIGVVNIASFSSTYRPWGSSQDNANGMASAAIENRWYKFVDNGASGEHYLQFYQSGVSLLSNKRYTISITARYSNPSAQRRSTMGSAEIYWFLGGAPIGTVILSGTQSSGKYDLSDYESIYYYTFTTVADPQELTIQCRPNFNGVAGGVMRFGNISCVEGELPALGGGTDVSYCNKGYFGTMATQDASNYVSGISEIEGTSAISPGMSVTKGGQTININLTKATTDKFGVTKIMDSVTSSNKNLAASANSVKTVNDKIDAMPKQTIITEAEYNSLSNKDSNTIYYIK